MGVNVRDGMDCKLRFLSSPGLLARSTFGQGHVLFCLVECNSSTWARVLFLVVLSTMLQSARKLRHGQSISQLVPQPFLYAHRAVQPTRNLWSGSSSSSRQQRSSDQMRERSDWQASADWSSLVQTRERSDWLPPANQNSPDQTRERDSWQSPFKLQ